MDVSGTSAQGMRDLWAVYDSHFAELGQAALTAVESVPELWEVVRAQQARLDPDDSVRRSEKTRQALKTAMLTGDWEEYVSGIRDTGSAYARAGLDFSVWSLVFTGF